MKKILLRAAILVVLFFIPKIVFGSVIINEIAWMGTTADYNDEWIELYNGSDQEINLSGWVLEATDGQPIINLSGTILAQSYFLLERTDDNSVPSITADQIYTGALGNSGEYLKLKDNSNGIIDEIDAVSSWSAGDNITKQTMEKSSTGWQTSLSPGGTPKAQNSSGAVEEPEEPTTEKPETPSTPTNNNPPIADAGDNIIAFTGQEIKFDGSKSSDPNNSELAYSWNMGDGKLIEQKSFTYKYNYPGTYLVTLMVYNGRNYAFETITIKIQPQQITINEFLPSPSGKDEEDEWIEIYNGSDFVVDISSWQLDDMVSGSKAFVFPQNTLIAPKSYLVFTRQITGIALNNDKDSVRLLFPEGIVFQEINYEKPPQGKSSARTDEGFVWNLPTPGAPNISGIVISENKNVSYQNPVKTQTVKEPSQDYAVLFQNQTENKIEGGYTAIAQPQNNIQKTENSQLAAVAPDSPKQNQNNLFLIITIIVLAGLLVGVLLTKVLKRFP